MHYAAIILLTFLGFTFLNKLNKHQFELQQKSSEKYLETLPEEFIYEKSQSFNQESSNFCKNLEKYGAWENWTEHNFNRSGITTCLNPKYPVTNTIDWTESYKPVSWQPFLSWRFQNFSGKWTSIDRCDFHSFQISELQSCFSHVVA